MTVPKKLKPQDASAAKPKRARKPYDGPRCGIVKHGNACSQKAGWGTDHVGEGRCKLHGGATPIKSGRYSKVTRPRIKQLLETFENDPAPLDLLPELALIRSLILDYIERYDEFTTALIAWHQDNDAWTDFEGNKHPSTKPVQVLDILSVAKYITTIGQLTERIEKSKKEGAVTLETLNRVMEQLGVELVAAVQETVTDEAQRSKLLVAVERRWSSIQLEQPGAVGRKGSAQS